MTYKPEPNTSVSSGTMRLQDLLGSLSSELARYDRGTADEHVLGEAASYLKQLEASSGDDFVLEDAAMDVLAELFDTLGSLAPEGCTFGAHPGDGADYGYWEVEDH